ncbi:MAG: hypothetical protein Q9195_006427 [Heterodermia aff. obscurata]
MPLNTELLVESAKTDLRIDFDFLLSSLFLKIYTDDNPSTEAERVQDNELNKTLVEKMERVRDNDFFTSMAVRGSDARFTRGWMRLEEYRHRWEKPYYQTYTDSQWKKQCDDLQEIYDEIKDAKP